MEIDKEELKEAYVLLSKGIGDLMEEECSGNHLIELQKWFLEKLSS